MTKGGWTAIILFPLVFLAVAGISGHQESFGQSCLSLALAMLLCFTAYPLSRVIFPDPVEAMIFSFPIGFVLHSLVLSWLAAVWGIHTLAAGVYIFLCVGIFLAIEIRKLHSTDKKGNAWAASDFTLLFCWLCATTALVAIPLAKVGIATPDGVAYRAYFNADFFRNLGVAASLSTTGVPPLNPYFAGEPLRYHWFFMVLPSYWQGLFPYLRPDLIMVQFSLISVMMFCAALCVIVRRYTTTRGARFLAAPLLLFCAGYDGILALIHLNRMGQPWTQFRDLNIDGLSRWLWNTPQVDALLRTMLYGPQHLVALTILLMAATVDIFSLKRRSRFLIYGLLFTAAAFSTFLAALAITVLGLALAWHALRGRRDLAWDLGAYAAGGGLFLVMMLMMQMFAADSGHLRIGADPDIMKKLPWYYLLEWGPPAILGVAGFFWNSGRMPVKLLAAVGLSSLAIILFARLDLTDRSVFSIKFGYLVHLSLLLLSVGFLDRLVANRSRLLLSLALVLAAPAGLTTAMDIYNSQDVENRKFTTIIDPHHADALAWIRRNVPFNAVVQNDIIGDEGYTDKFVTEIPPLARRSVYLSDPILSQLFQIPAADVEQRSRLLCELFSSSSPEFIYGYSMKAGIDYLFLEDRNESAVFQHLAEPYFTRAYERGEMVIFRVNAGRPRPDIFIPAGARESENRVLLRRDEEPLLQGRFGQNFYPPEPHGICEEARWMSNDAAIILNSKEELEGTVLFTALSLGKERTLRAFLNDREIFTARIGRTESRVQIPLLLDEGKNWLRLVCVEGPEEASLYYKGGDTRPLSFKILRLDFRKAP